MGELNKLQKALEIVWMEILEEEPNNFTMEYKQQVINAVNKILKLGE